MTAPSIRLAAPLLVAFGIAVAQVGYPPGGGPLPYPGQSPMPGGRIPMPGKGGKDTKSSKKGEPTQPLLRFRGSLKLVDEKQITLEMGDHRVLDFKRTSKTKFLEKGAEAKEARFTEGVEVTVEAEQDPGAYLTAVNVVWEAPPATAKEERDRKDGVVDTWEEPPKVTTERTPPAARPDPDDPGPPRLRRGGPADPARERSAQVPASDTPQQPAGRLEPARVESTAPPAPSPTLVRRIPDDDSPAVIPNRHMDDYIRRAAAAALEFTEGLPAYVCQEVMARFQSETAKPSWQALDVVTAALVYENGREEYRDIAINGKKTTKRMEETGGAWSTGEFGTVLIDLFSPATAAEFHFRRESRIAGINTRVYDFNVEREGSHWRVHAGSQSYQPAYKGSVWVDPQSARVMRIEMQAYGFPKDFPIDHSETATEYQYIRLGDARQYLLPVHAENLTCQRGTNFCSKNVIDFRNYHKYSGETTITFETPKQ